METTVRDIVAQLAYIDSVLRSDAEEENAERLLRESEIRQQMRVAHARRLLECGVEVEAIGKVTDLREVVVRELGGE